MAEVIKELTLDVARENRIQAVLAKQYDYKSRYLKVQIANDGEPIFVTAGTVVTINATRADRKNNSFLGEVNADGTVTVPLTQWMLALDDHVKCDIALTDAQGRKLTTATFTVEVERANYTGGDLAEVTASIGSSTGITAATVDGTTFIGKVGTAEEKSYTFSYDGSKWTLDSATVTLGDYGITVVGTPASGDTVTVTVRDNTGGLLVNLLADIAKLDSEVAKKANTDGYYSSLGAGTADQLNSPDGTTDNSAFNFRTTAGNESVTTGNVRIKSIRGKTIVWNQLINKANFPSSDTISGITFTTNTTDGTITINGTKTVSDSIHFSFNSVTLTTGHKYLYGTSVVGNNLYKVQLTSHDLSVEYNAWSDTIFECTAGSSFMAYVSIYTANTISITFKPQLFDLTQMFGAGNEPATVAEFRKMFPKDIYEYNAGELLSVKPSGIETVGFNLWDGEWEQGDIDDTGVDGDTEYAKSHYCRSKNFNRILGDINYYAICGVSGAIQICFYNEDKTYISKVWRGVECRVYLFASPENARFFRIATNSTYGNTYRGDICINFSWSGSKDGTYEPYEKRTRAVDTATYFPNGMRSAGSAYDEMDFERRKAVTRIGVVDLGAIDWGYEPGENYWRFYGSLPASCPPIKKVVNTSDVGNIITTKYDIDNIDRIWVHIADKIIGVTDTKNSIDDFWVYDSAYTDVATFKAAMSGVMLYYELETPTEVDIPDTVSNIYYADDWGTEEWMQDASATIPVPVPATLFYMRNLVDEIRNVRKNCLETSDSLDNLLAALGTACGGTFTKTWSDTDQEWKFTFTASAASQTAETEVAT